MKEDLSYALYSDVDLSTSSPYFRIDEQNGVITIRKHIDYEDPATPKLFKLFGEFSH